MASSMSAEVSPGSRLGRGGSVSQLPTHGLLNLGAGQPRVPAATINKEQCNQHG